MRTKPDDIRALIRAAAAEFGGSEAKLAGACGVTQNAVWAARRAGRVSAELALKIETATGGKVSRTSLRPDLWPPAEEAA
jgi:DNA-binding transcriptional regulator YdaS (Cro superfamily)